MKKDVNPAVKKIVFTGKELTNDIRQIRERTHIF